MNRPRIVCLCGSTRFWKEYQEYNAIFTLDGDIVLSVGFFVHQTEHGTHLNAHLHVTDAQKERLDELHLRKIDMADRVFIINVGGYMGDSTRAELAYARKLGKPVQSVEPLPET